MITDSRSFMSYPRHEYFRRVLCNLLGRDVETGEVPDDDMLIGTMIRNICYGNARQYFGFPPADAKDSSAQSGSTTAFKRAYRSKS
jgi:glucuronate isomerase